MPWRLLVGATAGCVSLMAAACGEQVNSEAERAVASRRVDYRLSADDLGREYRENEIAADLRYKGKVVEVTGTVGTIGKGLDSLYFVLKTSTGHADVQCVFTRSHEAKAALLREGRTVTVRGLCDGMTLLSVFLKGCTWD